MDVTDSDRVLLLDKPLEWTSFDVVAKLKKILKIKKIGHAGTLDPLATGLLIICTGKMTKQIEQYQHQEKEYTGSFVIGKSTASFDLETEVFETGDASTISRDQLEAAAKSLTGKIQQVPPLYSAIWVNGKRAYDIARKGKEVEMKSREVEVSVFEIAGVELPLVKFRIVCSKGTYIRSLARDFGSILGVGAYLAQLTRTRIGAFHLHDATTLEALMNEQKKKLENLSQPN